MTASRKTIAGTCSPDHLIQTRRAFVEHGVVAAAALSVAGTLSMHAADSVRASAATPTAATGHAPDAGTDHQTRGGGKDLHVLLSRAPTGADGHRAASSADSMAAAPVMEPLMHLLADGTLVPNLIETVPTIDNGLIAADGTITLTLLRDLTWSDGEPVSADDLVFTWKWVTTPANGTSTSAVWSGITGITAKDDRTAVVTLKNPSFAWYEPFTGVFNGILLPAHAFNNDPGNRNDAFLTAPIGTGPYVVTDFSSSGEITYAINPAYREQTKPWFRALAMSVGNDPAAAADAVASGAIDFAAGFALDPSAGATPDAAGTPGVVVTVASSSVEALRFNFSDPATTVQGEVSQKDTPHPIFSDPKVRQALNIAVNRGQIAATVYGAGVHTDANVLVGLGSWTAKDTGWAYNLDTANQILDDAGWTRSGDTRSKDGVDLAFEIVAPASDRRQQTLAILQEDFAKIGATVTVTPIDPRDFFSFDPAGAQSFYAMPWDAGLWADGTYSPAPLGYLRRWYAGPKGANIAQKANGWLSTQEVYDGMIADTQRYANPDYDALYESLETTVGQQDADALLLQMNDMLVKDVVIVPIVVLADRVGVAARLRRDNLGLGAFVSPLWNIANWNETGDTAS